MITYNINLQKLQPYQKIEDLQIDYVYWGKSNPNVQYKLQPKEDYSVFEHCKCKYVTLHPKM